MNSETNKEGFFRRQSWFKWLLILSVMAVLGYYSVVLFPENFEKSSIFTQYKELKDTLVIAVPDTSIQPMDSTSFVNDSLMIADSTVIDTIDNEYALPDSTNATTAVIDESYKFGASNKENDGQSSTNDLSTEKGNSSKSRTDMFHELLIASDPTLSLQQNFLTSKSITLETILKILASVGKDVLLNGNSDSSKEIFASIVQEEEVVGILIADRKGLVVYSSNSKFLNGKIKDIFPELTPSRAVIGQSIANDRQLSSLAIYHTYGQIGNIILITK